eukprot:TRINITY_DN9122_c0_g1_i1.p1 TRINITY_DN9122_c0_g1~~TRINITY_DN9122_c0_g1_i1.p1  ORF type:complete len:440 (+),score=71.47 TRINITY_DN9122_c0_g1_i1:171-1490(+)
MFECNICNRINGLKDSCYCGDCGTKVCVDCADLSAMSCPGCSVGGLDRSSDSKPKKKVQVLNRKKLSNVRVIQRNLVYVTNISLDLAKGELLKSDQYFGKFGKIKKIVVNRNNVYSGPQGRSVSAYVTYFREQDAAAAIASVDKMVIESRVLRASFGTTKYCSYFLRNVRCPNPDCMYLHELGSEDDSFTKEDMSQGKHLIISAQRVSKYHPDFMDSRDFSVEQQRSPSPTMMSSLTRSLEIKRNKSKKHTRSRSDSSLMDNDYYQDWQERLIKDSDVDFVSRKKPRKGESRSDDALPSVRSWVDLLFRDTHKIQPQPTGILNINDIWSDEESDFSDIWTIKEESPGQSRFAFARDADYSQDYIYSPSPTMEMFPTESPSDLYSPAVNSNWAMKNPAPHRSWDEPQKKGKWNYSQSSFNQQPHHPWHPAQFSYDNPPGL